MESSTIDLLKLIDGLASFNWPGVETSGDHDHVYRGHVRRRLHGADAVGISDHDTSDDRTNDGSDSDEDENDEDADEDDEDKDNDDPPSAGPSHALNFTATPSRLNLTPRKFHSDEFDMLPIQLFDLDYLQMKMAEAEENGD